MWLKYKQGWASHNDKEWSYRYLGAYRYLGESESYRDEYLQEVIDEINEEHSWSDKYRGITYEVVESPPSDVLREKIKSWECSLKSKSDHLDYLNNLLTEAEAFERFDQLDDAGPHSWKPGPDA